MDETTFCKEKGTTDLGRDYQDMIMADLILKLIRERDVVDFVLASNEGRYGSFDHIVLDVMYEDRKEKYAFQLKHKKERKLTLKCLTYAKGDFSIKKSFESIKNTDFSCMWILYTNSTPDFDIGGNDVKLENEDVKFKISRCTPVNLLPTCKKNSHCYKFHVITTNDEGDKQKKFLRKFFIYADQENVETVKKRILIEFQDNFFCDNKHAEEYVYFITKWNLRTDHKQKLDKFLIQRIIALIVLTPFTELTFGSCGDEIEKRRLLREAISSFDITVLETRDCTTVRSLWEHLKADLENTREKEKALKKYSVIIYRRTPDISDDVMWTELLWLMGKCPLIITENSATYEAIKLCPDMKYIICGTNSVKNILQNFSVFENLSDLRSRPNLYENIITTFKCSIQGKKEIDLKSVIHLNGKVCFGGTVSDLIKLLKCPCIGEEKEIISSTYVPRNLTVNLIDNKYFETVEEDTIIALDLMNSPDSIKSKLSNFNQIRIDSFLHKEKVKDDLKKIRSSNPYHRSLYHTSPILKTFVTGPDLYVSDNECSQVDFEQLCKRRCDFVKYHHLRVVDESFVEWINSNSSINDLERFRKERDFIKESNLYESKPETNINVVIGEPGMGKTELLKNLKNNSPPNLLSIFLNSNDVMQLCVRLEPLNQRRTEELISFIMDTKYKSCDSFHKKILKALLENGQVAYFWDALDEVSTNNLEIVIHLVNDLSQKSVFQWVTSRCNLKAELEKRFNVLSRSLRQLNKDEQTKYIYDRLRDKCSGQEIQEIIEKIIFAVTLIKHNDFLGVPLQISMLTELFRQDKDKYLEMLRDVFSLTELYQYVIDEKFKRYYKEKASVHCPNEALIQVLQIHKQSMFEEYEKAAVKSLLSREVLKRFRINCNNFPEEIKDIGFITEVTDNFPQFVHNSYAEYFVATYFEQHHKEIPKFEEIIFDQRYANVRFFYDLLTAKNSTAHIAVLYKNFDLLKQSENELRTCEDDKGRNVLQLACSWGRRYPVLDVEVENGDYIIDNEQDDSVEDETPEYTKMLQYILEYCKISDECISYAEKNDCLVAKILMLLNGSKGSRKLKIDKESVSILYYSAKFGYEKVIDLFEFTPFIKTKKDESSLLHLAVTYNHEQYLLKLLSLDDYRQHIDDVDKYGRTCLYIACQKGNFSIAKLLIALNANVNKATNQGCTPLHVACLYSFDEIVQLLITSKAHIDARKHYNVTPLHMACWNGNHTTVELLLRSKADIGVEDDDSSTPLYVSSRNKHDKVVELLLASGARIDQAQKDDATALFVASQHGHVNNVKLLLEAKADLSLATKTGETPVFIACQNGFESVVDLLLAYGADIDRATNDGWTPLQIACQQGHLIIVEKLMKKVKFPVDQTTYSLLHTIASNHGRNDIVELLQKYSL